MRSFKDLPKQFLLFENLVSANTKSNIFSGMWNSLLYASVGAVLAVILALLAAYAISHLDIKFKIFWFLLIYSGTILPFQIYLIPIYKGFTSIGLYDTRLGMILIYTAICIPFAIFVFRNFFLGISNEICESARLEGATDYRILISIFCQWQKHLYRLCFYPSLTGFGMSLCLVSLLQNRKISAQ